MRTAVSRAASLTIGTVESVGPDEVTVLLETDAPRSTALNTGVPTPFPRINSYVLIPNETGAVVGLVVWLGVQRSAYPKREGFKDFGLIDLPFPLRKLTLCPVGTLRQPSTETPWELDRGVLGYPSVGDAVILPSREQVIAIVTGTGPDGRLHLGSCPVAYGTEVTVDPDKLFGRHVAVLGNTGSGKSCTVAAIVRAAVQEADAARLNGIKTPNARFIVLDPNGEYSSCFADLAGGCRVFQVPPPHFTGAKDLQLPAWMWNSSEWSAIAQAAPRTQRPLLQVALRDLRAGAGAVKDIQTRVWARCRASRVFLARFLGTGTQEFADKQNVGEELERLREDLTTYRAKCEAALAAEVQTVSAVVANILTRRAKTGPKGYFPAFSANDIDQGVAALDSILAHIGLSDHGITVSEDTPLDFPVDGLADYLEVLGAHEAPNTAQYLASLLVRVRALLADTRLRSVTCPESAVRLDRWLGEYVGEDGAATGQVAVLDLSLVPSEILHLVIAVAGRLILEALQRYRKINNINLPTVLVLEEAHTFVAKRSPHGDEIPNPADMCRHTFERIAREGRKFGLGLVLSSQRPSELSETVLSQCNSFLLHRITNDKDQELVARLVPDNSRDLLRELPTLPTRHCVLLGIASKLPVLLEVPPLAESERPRSDDPKFWDVWTGKEPRRIDWPVIVADWQGSPSDHPDRKGKGS